MVYGENMPVCILTWILPWYATMVYSFPWGPTQVFNVYTCTTTETHTKKGLFFLKEEGDSWKSRLGG